jgi:hypothetical protein
MSDKVNELARQMRERAVSMADFVETKIVVERVFLPSEEQKKLYFNAGRWSAGATDWTARQAYEEFMKQEDGN